MGFAGDQPNRDALDLAPTGSAPANAVQGTIIYHTTSGLIYYTGSVWKSTNSTTLGEIGNVNTSILGNEQLIVWDAGNSEWKPSGINLNYLQDVSTGTPTLEDSLVWNGSAWTASGVTGGGGASALNDLSDVNTAGLAADEALVYDGGSWVPAPMDLNTNVAGDLGQLDDVTTAGLGDASGLAYNQGSKVWEPKNFNLGHHVTGSLDDLSDASLTAPASGETLQYNGSNWVNISSSIPSGYVWKEIDSAELTSSTQEISVSGMNWETDAVEFKAEFRSIELDSTDDLAVRIGTTITLLTASLYDWSSISIQDGSSASVRVNSDNQAHVTSQAPAAVATGKNTAVTVIYKNPDRATGSHPVFETWATSPDGNDTSQSTHMGSFTYASDVSFLDEIQLTVDVDASATMASGVTAKLYALVPLAAVVFDASPTALDDLTDVAVPSPASGETLRYNGSSWVNSGVSQPASGYVWEVISEGTATGTGTSLPVVNFNGSGYKEIKYKITNLDVSADTFLQMTMQSSVPADIDSDYQYAHMAGATDGANPATDSSTSSTDGVLHYAASLIDTNSNGQSAFEFTIQNPTDSAGSSKEVSVICQGGFYRTDGKHMTTQGTLIYDGATTAHGFKIETGVNSANISCDYECLALVSQQALVFDADPTDLDDLTDVVSPSPASGDTLRYNGSNWVNHDMTDVYEWTLIEQKGLPAVSSVSLSGIQDSAHGTVKEAKMILKNVLLSADAFLEARVIDATGTVQSGATEYRWSNQYSGSSTIAVTNDSSDDAIRLTNSSTVLDTLSEIHYELTFINPDIDFPGIFKGIGGGRKTDGVKTTSITSSESLINGDDIDGLQIFPSTGNLGGANAIAELWVLRKRNV